MSEWEKTQVAGGTAVEPIAVEEILRHAAALRTAGWRLVQILAVSMPETTELSWSFGRDLDMRVLRAQAAPGKTVPSITPSFPGAYLYENEIRDLFGVAFAGISIDWLGKTYEPTEAGKFSKLRVGLPSGEGGER